MQKQHGRNNAASLFGVHQIPCDNQIRNMLDPVPPETLFGGEDRRAVCPRCACPLGCRGIALGAGFYVSRG